MTHPRRDPDPNASTHRDESATFSDEAETLRLTLAEETLQARVVEREQGKLLIHTRIETQPVTAKVELLHDDMVIDEVDVNEQAAERREPWYDGDTLMVPVYEEVLVSSTQLMLRKVIRVRNRGAREQVNLRGTVRREVLDIEEVDS
jgi:stress response protein YsnF